MSLNTLIITGNLGSDPRFNLTPSGKKKAAFSIATSRTFKIADGSFTKQTEWTHVVAWGTLASRAQKLLNKGISVLVHGEKRTFVVDRLIEVLKDPVLSPPLLSPLTQAGFAVHRGDLGALWELLSLTNRQRLVRLMVKGAVLDQRVGRLSVQLRDPSEWGPHEEDGAAEILPEVVSC